MVLTFLVYVCVVALNATAFSLLVKFLLPDVLNNGKLYTIAGWDVYITEIIIATVLLLVFMLVTIRGASVSGSLQYYILCGDGNRRIIDVLWFILW